MPTKLASSNANNNGAQWDEEEEKRCNAFEYLVYLARILLQKACLCETAPDDAATTTHAMDATTGERRWLSRYTFSTVVAQSQRYALAVMPMPNQYKQSNNPMLASLPQYQQFATQEARSSRQHDGT